MFIDILIHIFINVIIDIVAIYKANITKEISKLCTIKSLLINFYIIEFL